MTVRSGAGLVLLAATLAAAASCARPPEAPPPAGGMLEKEALKLVARYDDAWMRKDMVAIGKLLAADYVYFSSRGDVSDLAATRAMLSSPGYRLERGRRDDLKAYRHDATVVVSTHWTGAGVFDGKPFTDDQRCSVVVAFAGGTGKILSEHCTRIP
ncbi:MAG TPA: nuclear transport factor 2 family protein [Thermoanaerobaculia bacterium]|nr:nuclear transport factor 2 family protein [Thermoanaerobaculia bacterium]